MELEFRLYRSVCDIADVRDCYQSYAQYGLNRDVFDLLDYVENNGKEDWLLDLIEEKFERAAGSDLEELITFLDDNVKKWKSEFGI